MRPLGTTVATLAVGSLLAWMAASGQLNVNLAANAAGPSAKAAVPVAHADPMKESLGGGQPAEDAKKPNILVIRSIAQSRRRSSRWDTRQVNSAKTTSATGTNICPRSTDLTSSLATCIT